MNNIPDIIKSLSARLQAIDYNQLPISDYNKQYIGNLKPAMLCINWLIKISGKAGLLIAPFIFLSCSQQGGKS